MAEKVKLRIELNGTSENSYHTLGLTQNPFPQIAQRGYDRMCLRLQSLGGDPIPDEAYIRQRLHGFSPEFVELCCHKFVPGEMVRFEVEFLF